LPALQAWVPAGEQVLLGHHPGLRDPVGQPRGEVHAVARSRLLNATKPASVAITAKLVSHATAVQ
jgi:hypothetical protein